MGKRKGLLRRAKPAGREPERPLLERPSDEGGPGPLARGVSDLKDVLAPDGIQVERDYLVVGQRYVRVFFVSQVPRLLSVGVFDNLYHLGDVDISIHVEPIPDAEVVKDLTRRVVRMEAQYIMQAKRDRIEELPRLRKAMEDAEALRARVQSNEDGLYHVFIQIVVGADTLEDLETKSRMLEAVLGGGAIHLRRAMFRQAEAFRTAAPLAVNLLPDTARNFNRGAATALFPFTTADLVHPRGVYLGLNEVSGAPVFFDAWNAPNYSICVFGEAGSGKSYLVKLLTGRGVIEGVRTVIIDPDGEYRLLMERLGGVHVKFFPDRPAGINPLDLEDEVDEVLPDGTERRRVNILEKVAEVKGLVAVMFEGVAGEKMTNVELGVLDEAVRAVYQARGFSEDPATLYEFAPDSVARVRRPMPTLSDLYRELVSRGEEAKRIAAALKPYVAGGSLAIFDGPTTVDLGAAPAVCFDISYLEERFLAPLAMHIAFSWTWNKFAKQNRRRKRIVVDEAWKLLRYEEAARFLERAVRTGRKWNVSLTCVSQMFLEFTESLQGRAILANSDTVMLLRQSATVVDAVQKAFGLTDGEAQRLPNFQRGEVLLRQGREAALVRVMASPAEEWFAETDPNKLLAMQQAAAAGQ
ncbi:MAG: VirB4 family type IV secretion system protein [Moorellales bacterium]